MRRVLLGLSAAAVLCSCATLGTRQAADRYVDAAFRETLKHAAFTLQQVEVEKGIDSQRVELNAEYIFQLLLSRLAAEEAQPGPRLYVRALIKEEPFVRDFRTMNAVTVQLQAYGSAPEAPVAASFYSENTEDTILSYRYLYRLIRRALKRLRR